MKQVLRALIFLTAGAIIVAFFLPWISLEISGVKILNISGLDIYRNMSYSGDLFKDQVALFKIKLLLIPVFSLYTIIAIYRKWSSFLYVIPAVLILAYYIYISMSAYDMVSKSLDELLKQKEIIDRLSGLTELSRKKIALDYKVIGKGLYITVIGFILINIMGIKEMFTAKKRWGGW